MRRGGKYEMAERTGFEPATPGVTGRYSNQLNYRSVGPSSVQLTPAVPVDERPRMLPAIAALSMQKRGSERPTDRAFL